MRIFVTGGTGFIGKPTTRELQKHGHQLLLLIREKGAEGKELLKTKGLSFVYGDLSNPSKWMQKVKRFRPAAALHMAWEGLPDYGPEISEKNLFYGLQLYKILGKIGCKKVVTTGSCWEYGADKGKLKEDMPVKPFNAFSAAKNALHWLGKEVAVQYDMQFIWTRLFFVYGPGQREGSLIPYVLRCKKENKKPILQNPLGGNDFIYVEDVARALCMILKKNIKDRTKIYNIGTGELISNARIVNSIYGRKIYKEPSRPYGFYANISKIKKEIGWYPTVDIGQGIKYIYYLL